MKNSHFFFFFIRPIALVLPESGHCSGRSWLHFCTIYAEGKSDVCQGGAAKKSDSDLL